MSEQEQLQSQLEPIQMELELSLQSKWQYTQTKLKQSQTQMEQTQLELARLQSDLNRIQVKLDFSQSIIAAMQTSKFWKLRTAWFRLKKFLGISYPTEIVNLGIGENIYTDFTISLSPISQSVESTPREKYKSVIPIQLENHKKEITKMYMSTLKSFLYSGFKLKIPTSEKPLLTVILILYNRAELTLQCLRYLCEDFSFPFEIVILDNASYDETHLLLSRLDGVKVIYNKKNIHFLLAANQGAVEAKGKYILFLNNDAQVQPGSINSALRTIESSNDIGAVGGKIILMDGSLQEAGSIVWKDGSCQGYGRGDSPFYPMYMFTRDVDYCSGAFLLTKRDLFLQMGGFDTDYQPAYYEETDYCLRLWQRGKRVVYDPDAVILHFEFASSKSTDTAIHLQVTHRETFVKKHSNYLQDNHLADESSILLARTANKACPNVLFIDDRVPHSVLGSGFPRAREILLALIELGYFVTLYPLDFYKENWDSVYQDIPNVVEVMIDYGANKLEDFLRERQGYYDIIFVSRPHNMQIFKSIFEKNPGRFDRSKIIYDAEAIFSIREVAKRRLNGEQISETEVDSLVNNEVKLATGVNSIISVSEAEREKFIQYGLKKVYTVGHTLSLAKTDTAFEKRSGILFVGAIHDSSSPNADSVFWFVKQILPQILDRLGPDVKFLIVGSNRSEEIVNLACEHIKVIGRVENLTDYYSQARIFVAPTRFAAGIPFKVHHAAAHGLPIVATSLIASQLGWLDGKDLLTADEPKTFAEQCVRLYTQAEVWQKLRDAALSRIQDECSRETFISKLQEILKFE